MLVFFALGNAKVLSFALADAKVPNASSFAFWWNIGFKVKNSLCNNNCYYVDDLCFYFYFALYLHFFYSFFVIRAFQ